MPIKTVAIIGSGISGLLSAKHALENNLLPFVDNVIKICTTAFVQSDLQV